MHFLREAGTVEWITLIVFALAYLLYLARTLRIGYLVQTTVYPVFIKPLWRISYILLLFIAMLAPSFGDVKKEIKAVGKDIFILVDLSRSMDADDLAPSRLEKLKFELKKIIKRFNSDRIGLIIFSSDAFVQCPLTHDLGATLLFTETMHTGLVPHAGTDMGPALELAGEKFSDEKGDRGHSKIIILAGDGEDFGTHTLREAENLVEKGYKIFTLGVGTEEGGRIPTGKKTFLKDNNGNEVVSQLNAKDLKKIGSLSDGGYFEISDRRNDTEKLIETISKVKGSLIMSGTVDTKANKYFYFVFIAFIMAGIDVLITVKTMRV